MSEIYENLVQEQKALVDILKAEAKTAKCLSKILCKDIRRELKCVFPIELRIELLKKALEALACKECAMANVISAVNCKMKINGEILKKDKCICKKRKCCKKKTVCHECSEDIDIDFDIDCDPCCECEDEPKCKPCKHKKCRHKKCRR